MMQVFEETENILPRNAMYAMAVILVATDVFILICTQLDIGTPMWAFIVTTAIFAAMLLACMFIKMRISIDEETITVRLIKKYTIPFSTIIDFKIGDIDVIRNYSGWGIKNVKFKNIICLGYDRGISLKLLGKKVVTISTSDPEGVAAMLHINKE